VYRRSRFPRASTIRGMLFVAVLVGATLVVLGFPLVMLHLSGSRLPWDRMADIGDAYGGASSLLSAAALCGVGASLVYQQRQIRQEAMMIERQQHFELIKLGLEDPHLLRALDRDLADSPVGRQIAYLNLLMNYWLAMWEIGEVDDEELFGLASGMFRYGVARDWWKQYGPTWIGTRVRPRRQRFIEVVSAACAAADSPPPPSPLAEAGRRSSRWRHVVAVGVPVACAGIAVGVSRLRRDRRGR
jgi:Family of unknown function (DUF6082)